MKSVLTECGLFSDLAKIVWLLTFWECACPFLSKTAEVRRSVNMRFPKNGRLMILISVLNIATAVCFWTLFLNHNWDRSLFSIVTDLFHKSSSAVTSYLKRAVRIACIKVFYHWRARLHLSPLLPHSKETEYNVFQILLSVSFMSSHPHS